MLLFILILLGLCFGSFVNALVWRVHVERKQKKHGLNLSILKGRSMCVDCHHTLAWYDLIPVFSWLLLRARCRYCKKPISPQYPIVELSSAILFIVSYIYWPFVLIGGTWIVFCVWLLILTGLIALFIYDLKWMLLPNKIMSPVFILGLFYVLLNAFIYKQSTSHIIFSAFWAVIVGGGIFYLLFQVSKGKWIGGGDVKLGALLGLIVGKPAYSLMVILMSSVLGTLFVFPLLLTGRIHKDSKIPYGPFLIAAGIIVVLFGSSIMNYYTNNIISTIG